MLLQCHSMPLGHATECLTCPPSGLTHFNMVISQNALIVLHLGWHTSIWSPYRMPHLSSIWIDTLQHGHLCVRTTPHGCHFAIVSWSTRNLRDACRPLCMHRTGKICQWTWQGICGSLSRSNVWNCSSVWSSSVDCSMNTYKKGLKLRAFAIEKFKTIHLEDKEKWLASLPS